jgi:hypothetical protein
MIWWEPDREWTFWSPVPTSTQIVEMHPGSEVTALWRIADKHLDLFATDEDGVVWSIYWDADDTPGMPMPGSWRSDGWLPIHRERKMNPGATVTAIWGVPGKHLDLFATGTDDTVWSIWWDSTMGWRSGGWFTIGDSYRILPGQTVTALYNPVPPSTHLALFAIGGGNRVNSAFWEPDLGW